ncbi:MAG: insulinase family protein, partial [Ruminococcaceae bacterium]|nr:insulinase family protein [Oscillospiraceae bacterium]
MAVNIKTYADLAPNSAYALEYEEYLDDIKTAGIILRHKKSGARVCVLSNNDENKMFCAAFRTPVGNDTGVPHIIEHSVLNGSKNFPSRDPFMQLVKGSLNTFLNAMTYIDKTLYPVASCNDKDFKNLMHVYLDAVFYPNIYSRPEIFMQEGWHYELESPEDELTINGVVYNEMKGAVSAPAAFLNDTMMKGLFPDSPYGKNSGGDPAAIPELSYEQFLDFHRSHYHPSNSYIFIYGDCDMDERLRFMDENYLSAFDAIDPHTEISPVVRFGESEPRRIKEKYSVSSTDEVDGKSYLAYGALCNSALNVTEATAWDILSEVLIYSEGAPIKQALFDAGIGSDIGGGYETHMLENAFYVTAKEAASEDLDRFHTIVREVLAEQVTNGISEKALLAALNRREFAFREADYGSFPRGLDYATNMLLSWLYDDSAAFSYLHILDVFADLKAKIGTGYYENLIKTQFLDSDHSVLVLLEAERGLVEKQNEELAKKLASYKASLSPEEISAIAADTAHLREYQSMEPTEEETNCIPTLEREDIPRTTQPFSNEEREIGGIKGLYHDIETNGITYGALLFDIGSIPEEYLPYVGILGSLLGKLDTAKRSFADLYIDIKMNTGSLSFHPATYRLKSKEGSYKAMFGIFFRVLGDKVPYVLNILPEIIKTSKFEDTKRLKERIGELKADKQDGILNSGHAVATQRARSYFSAADAYLERIDGIDYYRFLTDLTDNFDKYAADLASKLRAVTNYIFAGERMMFSIAADEGGYRAFTETLPVFAAELDTIDHGSLGEYKPIVPVKKNEGIMIASQVQYAARAGSFAEAGLPYTGALQVVRTAVNIDYLYQQIRVKGGAYGCGCGFSNDLGAAVFYSYRDPKL